MIPNAKRGSILALEIAIVEAAAMCGRRSARLLFDALAAASPIQRSDSGVRKA